METKKYPTMKEFKVGDILYHVTDRDINPFRILEMCETDVDWVKINDHFDFYIHESESYLSFGRDEAFTTMDEAKECLLKRLDEKLLKLTEDLNETSNTILRIKSKQPYEEKLYKLKDN
jgi:hypothetical protein